MTIMQCCQLSTNVLPTTALWSHSPRETNTLCYFNVTVLQSDSQVEEHVLVVCIRMIDTGPSAYYGVNQIDAYRAELIEIKITWSQIKHHYCWVGFESVNEHGNTDR